MNYIRIYDNETKQITRLLLKQDNIISKDYFIATFPDATGILFKDEQSNEFVSYVDSKSKESLSKYISYFIGSRKIMTGTFNLTGMNMFSMS